MKEEGQRGLTTAEAHARLAREGRNEIEARVVRPLVIWLRQFRSAFVYLLFVAALVSFSLGDVLGTLLILAFVFINSTLGFSQEYASEHALELLREFAPKSVRVFRDGAWVTMDARELVVGDVVALATGDRVPADLRLREADALTVDESLLTGESASVPKTVEQDAFASTLVTGGQGVGIVTATGSRTKQGAAGRLAVETAHVSAFEIGMTKFSRTILKLILLTLAGVFVLNLAIKGADRAPDLLLFSLALAVSVVPEALPLVTSISLSRGALRLAKEKVVVRRLAAIEDLGSIDVLCADKTGTITENRLTLVEAWGISKREAVFLGALSANEEGGFDAALRSALDSGSRSRVQAATILERLPFDPATRQNGVRANIEGRDYQVRRGAPETLLAHCQGDDAACKEALDWSAAQGREGRRTLAIGASINDQPWRLVGILAFEDPLKPTAAHAIRLSERLGVRVKILTGDAPEVATAVARRIGLIKPNENAMTGEEFTRLTETERERAALEHDVFARVDPTQKYEILRVLKKTKDVGFLGEGINDTPALKMAHVGLVVQGASDIARDAADIVLLDRSLDVIVNGIRLGREVFANTAKYIRTTLASNFGNFYSIAAASLFIDFLPMLPVQILLLNLLSDFPMIAISTDAVDADELTRPRHYHIHDLLRFATALGLVSMAFDFAVFLLYARFGADVLQTNWFVASILTELALIYVLRTKKPFWSSAAPGRLLIWLTIPAAALTLILPYTRFGQTVFKFVAPSPRHLATILVLTAAYFAASELTKRLVLMRTKAYHAV